MGTLQRKLLEPIFLVGVLFGVTQHALALVGGQETLALQSKGEKLSDRRQVPQRQLLSFHGAQSFVPDGEEEKKFGQGIDHWLALGTDLEGAVNSR